MSNTATREDVARLERQIGELKALIAPVLTLAVRQKSRREQARKAGVSVRTLQRRERKIAAKISLAI